MSILQWPGKTEKFAKEVKVEMQKVSWPSRPEVINSTMVVLIAVLCLSTYLFGIDMVYSLIRSLVIRV